MKKSLLFSLVLLIAGAVMFCIPMANAEWDWEKLDTETITMKNFTTEGNEDISAANVANLDVKINSTKFTVTRGGTEFTFEYHESDIYTYSIELNDGTLKIREERHGWKHFLQMFNGLKRTKKTTVLNIPEAFEGNVNLVAANSDMNLENAKFQMLNIDTVNGDVRLKNVAADGISVRNVNGGIDLESIETPALNVEDTNGDLSVKSSNVESLSARTVNGKLEFSGLFGKKLSGKTTNGDVKINDSSLTDEMRLKTVNGRVDVNHCVTNVVRAESTNGDVSVMLIGFASEYQIDGKSGHKTFAGNQAGNDTGKLIYVRTVNGSISVKIQDSIE